MSRIPFLAAVCAACAALSACAGITVKADVNTALIGQVHCGSYAWAGGVHGNSPLRSTVANPVNEARLREAIASHLRKGSGLEVRTALLDLGKNTQGYLQRSASLGFWRYLSWQFLHAVVITPAASIILS